MPSWSIWTPTASVALRIGKYWRPAAPPGGVGASSASSARWRPWERVQRATPWSRTQSWGVRGGWIGVGGGRGGVGERTGGGGATLGRTWGRGVGGRRGGSRGLAGAASLEERHGLLHDAVEAVSGERARARSLAGEPVAGWGGRRGGSARVSGAPSDAPARARSCPAVRTRARATGGSGDGRARFSISAALVAAAIFRHIGKQCWNQSLLVRSAGERRFTWRVAGWARGGSRQVAGLARGGAAERGGGGGPGPRVGGWVGAP